MFSTEEVYQDILLIEERTKTLNRLLESLQEVDGEVIQDLLYVALCIELENKEEVPTVEEVERYRSKLISTFSSIVERRRKFCKEQIKLLNQSLK